MHRLCRKPAHRTRVPRLLRHQRVPFRFDEACTPGRLRLGILPALQVRLTCIVGVIRAMSFLRVPQVQVGDLSFFRRLATD